MDRPLDPGFLSRRLRTRLLAGLIAVAAGAGVVAMSRAALTPSVERAEVRTARVERGIVATGVEASGTVVPAVESVIASPIEARVMRVVRQAGDAVKAGDPIVELDASEARLALERLEQQLAQKENERRGIEAELEESVAALTREIAQKRLDAEIVTYRAEQNRKLRAEGLISDEALRQAVVAEKKAAIELEQLDDQVASARRGAVMDLEALALDIDVLRKEIAQASAELGRTTGSSDRSGIVTWVTPQVGAVVRRGEALARVADLASLRIAGTISDVHASSIATGLPVRVRAADLRLEGRIVSVDPTVAEGIVRFIVEIETGETAELRNNQRVDLEVLTAAGGETLRLPRGNYAAGAVFRIDGDQAVRTAVRFGRTDAESVEVAEGLREGDEVIVSDMDGLWHVEKVKLR